MELTRKQAIAEHRKMWNWIADETLRKGYKVKKKHYLKKHGFGNTFILNDCFCCKYVSDIATLRDIEGDLCSLCPVDAWDLAEPDECMGGLFHSWLHSDNFEESAKLARQIANLPERTDNIPVSENE